MSEGLDSESAVVKYKGRHLPMSDQARFKTYKPELVIILSNLLLIPEHLTNCGIRARSRCDVEDRYLPLPLLSLHMQMELFQPLLSGFQSVSYRCSFLSFKAVP